jgi:5-methylcytosine-specific restriction protein A
VPARLAHPADRPWRRFYGLNVWKVRRRHQLQIEPLCRACLAVGEVTAATIADHIVAHGGDWNSFRRGELQSLCKPCHDHKGSAEWRGYRDDVGADGLRINPRHPLNRVGKSPA